MLIAIDFDDTLTRAPELWRTFIESAKSRGHKVVCVTARCPTEEDIDIVDGWMKWTDLSLPVYYTSHGSKTAYMKAIGLKVDIWIDDDPRRCALGW